MVSSRRLQRLRLPFHVHLFSGSPRYDLCATIPAHVDVFLEHVEDSLAAGLADAHPRLEEANPRGAKESISGDSGDMLDPGEHVAHDAAKADPAAVCSRGGRCKRRG